MNDLISEVDILDESKKNFLTYAEEVLCDRAIPAAEDGLLSAQRKLIWTMEDHLKMNAKSNTKKCNAIVGNTLATSYYHGDQACYGVLCKMSQDYLMRYPLVIGQGSLGTQENNDMRASARYTEAKPSEYADLMMINFGKDAVPLKLTYNNEYYEPVILPSLFPNALCNGRQAIGISMAHNSLPHNLTEICNALVAILKNENLTIDEFMQYVPGPDFPLGGTVINKNDIKAAFATGKSAVSLKVRGDYEIRNNEIIFTTIPYRTYRNKIKEQIEKNIEVFDKYFDDFNDESGIGKNRLVFIVKKGVNTEDALKKLFALTDLQTTLSYNMNFIVNGTPRLCSMLDLSKSYIEHQNRVLINVATFDKNVAEKRVHILEGMLIAIEDIDTAISIIRNSNDKAEAATKLIKHFNITEVQAKAILDMKLAKLTKLDKDDLLNELKSKKELIAECEKIQNDKNFRSLKLIEKIEAMRQHYGDTRRTQLIQLNLEEETEDIEIIPEDVVVTISQTGDMKRIPASAFKVQKKNGKGIKNKGDVLLTSLNTNTTDSVLLFTDKGKMYKVPVNNIPEGTNISKGVPANSFVKMETKEKITTAISLRKKTDAEYMIFITKQGRIKKTALSEYKQVKRENGIAALSLYEGDSLLTVIPLKDEELVLITKKGLGVRISTTEISAIGRVTKGVRGMKLADGDEVVAALPVHKLTDSLALFTKRGYAKKTSLDELPRVSRSAKGIIVYKLSETTGDIVGGAMISDDDKLLLVGVTNSICIAATDIPLLSRNTTGSIMIQGTLITEVIKI